MTDKGRILLADDEPTFRESTADLLRREGYECDTVNDGDSALEQVSAQSYHLLISDLEMPGNADLSLVRSIAAQVGGLPVIIVTAFPSVRSAIACIELPVSAYLMKPVDFGELCSKVDAAVSRFRAFQAMRSTEQRLRDWNSEMQALASVDSATAGAPSVDTFLALTLRNVMGSLTDLDHLSRALTQPNGTPAHACQILNCPRGIQLREAVKETIRVLEETKGSFRSKTLGTLRQQLEVLMEVN